MVASTGTSKGRCKENAPCPVACTCVNEPFKMAFSSYLSIAGFAVVGFQYFACHADCVEIVVHVIEELSSPEIATVLFSL